MPKAPNRADAAVCRLDAPYGDDASCCAVYRELVRLRPCPAHNSRAWSLAYLPSAVDVEAPKSALGRLAGREVRAEIVWVGQSKRAGLIFIHFTRHVLLLSASRARTASPSQDLKKKKKKKSPPPPP